MEDANWDAMLWRRRGVSALLLCWMVAECESKFVLRLFSFLAAETVTVDVFTINMGPYSSQLPVNVLFSMCCSKEAEPSSLTCKYKICLKPVLLQMHVLRLLKPKATEIEDTFGDI